MKKPIFYDNYHKNNRNKTFFSTISDNNFTYYINVKHINEVLARIKKKKIKILDLGCGVGSLAFYLSKFGHEITGYDVSKRAIDVCNKYKNYSNIRNVFFLRKDILRFHSKKAEYDLVICSGVIEHIENDNLLVTKIYESLKNGGYLFLTTPSKNAPLYKMGLLNNFDERVGHLRRYSSQDMIDLLHRHHFQIINQYKVESFVRNSLYTFPALGFLIKFIRGPLVGVFHEIDSVLVSMFGESNLIFICRKPG